LLHLSGRTETYGVNIPVTIDFENDTIRFQDYDMFTMLPSRSMILDVTPIVTTYLMNKILSVTKNCSVSLLLSAFHVETLCRVLLENPKKSHCSEEHLPVAPV